MTNLSATGIGDAVPNEPSAWDRIGLDRPLAGRKVLIIVENLPVPFDRRVWMEATTLHRAGAQVAIISPTGKEYTAHEETIDGIHIFRHELPADASSALGYLKEYGVALWCELRLAIKVWRRMGFDVIHACNPPDLIFLVALPFKLIGKRFLFDHHDINPELYEAKFGRRDVFWQLMRLFEWMTFKLADVSIATNESYRRIAIERGGMNPARIAVVRSGPDISRFHPVDPDESLKNGRRFLIGYVGVIGEQEGLDLLLEAVAHIVHVLGRHDIQICIVGSGSSLAQMQQLSVTLDIATHVTFLGRVSDDRLMQILSTSDVCVNPDRVNPMNDKSTMNKIIEYMAMGKPIVQFDVTEGRFSAQDASLYAKANDPVDFAERICELVDDKARRDVMGAVGRDRVERHLSWEHQIDKLIGIYQQALAKRA